VVVLTERTHFAGIRQASGRKDVIHCRGHRNHIFRLRYPWPSMTHWSKTGRKIAAVAKTKDLMNRNASGAILSACGFSKASLHLARISLNHPSKIVLRKKLKKIRVEGLGCGLNCICYWTQHNTKTACNIC